MCGIAGYILAEQPEGRSVLQAMCDAMAHRGPDGDGFYTDGRFGMGMRRLSIIDLAGGDQPIANEDGTKQIVFNGEIYNYGELRPQLVARGHEFRTDSDTETILHLFEESGRECVQQLNGMFGISIWDEKNKKLFLARDRMGVKPMYYYWDGRNFLFASEIKAIIKSGIVDLEINPQAIWDYLTFRYVPQPESIWKNVHKLPPGHTLEFDLQQGEPQIRRYWDIPYTDDIEVKSPEEYVSEFEDLFLSAVRYRLIADVPVGVLLSGGIDSSAVAAAISEVHNARLNSFSVAFEDSPDTNELAFARQVAAHTGTIHHEVLIGRDEFLDFLPGMVYHSDEPIADLASVPLYYVSQLARQSVKVVLSGEGSDEVLAGYGFERTQQMWNTFQRFQVVPRPLRQAAAAALGPALPTRHRAKAAWLRLPPEEWLRQTPFNMTHALSEQQKARMFLHTNGFLPSLSRVMQDTRRAATNQALHQALYTYCQSWLVEDLLMKADKMTMANSIELRVPFLDYRLVEWAARTPVWVKVGGGPAGDYASKWVLRRFSQSRLPVEIINRPKRGFPVPVYDWLSGQIKDWAHDMLQTPNARIYAWLQREEVAASLARGTAASASIADRHNLWHLLILEQWLQVWDS